MVSLIQLLFRHQAWADAEIVRAVARCPGAVNDEALRRTLHHIVGVQRAFLAFLQKRTFDVEKEKLAPATHQELEGRFRETHAEGIQFVNALREADLVGHFAIPGFPQSRLTVVDALMQTVMHSQHHRGQAASRLRALGGEPPTVDYIVWLKDRPEAYADRQ